MYRPVTVVTGWFRSTQKNTYRTADPTAATADGAAVSCSLRTAIGTPCGISGTAENSARKSGSKGATRNRTGHSGDDLIIPVPVGTVIRDRETGLVLADLNQDAERAVVARGGRPGRGNVRYANSVRQAPRFARTGEPGEERELQLELKLIADVGLVGMPNVGKSTLLSVISAARPKIANYPFTTLEPSLGVVRIDDREFVAADIPGLVEGAHEGAGLGQEFLRHVERTRLLLHVVDVSGSEGREPLDDYRIIRSELEQFRPALATRPQVIVAGKADVATDEDISRFRAALKEDGVSDPVFAVSGVTRQGLTELLRHIADLLETLPAPVLFREEETVSILRPLEEELYMIEAVDDVVSGDGILDHGPGVVDEF